MTSLHELKMDLDCTIKEAMEELLDYPRQRDDKLQELVDDQIPDSYSQLAECLMADNSLAQVDDPGMLPGFPTVWNIIRCSIREALIPYAHEEFDRLQSEYDDIKGALEDEGFEVGYKGKNNGKHYIYRTVNEDEAYPDGEEVIKDGFTCEYEAWMWLEENEPKLEKAS